MQGENSSQIVLVRMTVDVLKALITTKKTMDPINQKRKTQMKIQTICGSDFHVLHGSAESNCKPMLSL